MNWIPIYDIMCMCVCTLYMLWLGEKGVCVCVCVCVCACVREEQLICDATIIDIQYILNLLLIFVG